MIYDVDIRKALLDSLSDVVTTEELGVYCGRAIADVVTIHQGRVNCYEIKSDADNIKRAIVQAEIYDTVFSTCTVVTTLKHVEGAMTFLPWYWGCIIAHKEDGEVILRKTRDAELIPGWIPKNALLSLWREELLLIAENLSVKVSSRMNKFLIAEALSANTSEVEIRCEFHNVLLDRIEKGKGSISGIQNT
jgi:hypothetical protein